MLPPTVRAVIQVTDRWLRGGEFSAVDPSSCRKVEAASDGSIEIRYAITIGEFPAWVAVILPQEKASTFELAGWICSLVDVPGEEIASWIDKQEKLFADGRRFYVDERLRVMMSRTLVIAQDSSVKIKEMLDEYFFALGILWMDLHHNAKIKVRLPFEED